MYRIVCESLKNYLSDFSDNDAKKEYRYKIILPLILLSDIDKYRVEKSKGTLNSKKLQDFLYFASQSIDSYPRFKALLWTLESRGFKGIYHGVSSPDELQEQAKIINMFLRLAYWS